MAKALGAVISEQPIAEQWLILERANEVINISEKRSFFCISKDMLKKVSKPMVTNYGKHSAKIVNSYEGNNLTLSMENVVNVLEHSIAMRTYNLKVLWDFDGVRIVSGDKR
jgi:hypothetical protein